MRKLESIVSIDVYLNESVQHANYVRSAPTFPERSGANINRIASATVADKDSLSRASHLDMVRVSIRPHNADNPAAQGNSFGVGATG